MLIWTPGPSADGRPGSVTVGAVACALPLFSEVLTSSSPLPFISDLKASVHRLNWSEGQLPGNRHMIGTTEA